MRASNRRGLGAKALVTTDNRLAAAMPGALVGAEIMLDGELWNVIRPIGAEAGGATHCAVRGGSLDSLVQGEIPTRR
jgi:hypothetical protein